MFRKAFYLFILIYASGYLAATPVSVTVSDFKVESDNPAYKYIGKGISRLVAVELRKSSRIKIIEREELDRILQEQELNLTDLVDQVQQTQVGRLLPVQYIVLGEIIDMNTVLLISLRMVQVETCELVWQENLQEKLSTYDYIGAYFAQSILSTLNLGIEQAIIAKLDKKEEKQAETIVKISSGIDAYERKDTERAKKILEEARDIDPGNEVAAYFLAKLAVNTSKFKVIPEPYYTYNNPAFLGIIKTDTFYFAGGAHPCTVYMNGNAVENINCKSYAPNKYISEMDMSTHLGYFFPVGKSFGIGVEALWYTLAERTWTGEYSAEINTQMAQRVGMGGIINAGVALGDNFSLGLGFGLWAGSQHDSGPFAAITNPDHTLFSVNVGFLYKNSDETILFDTRFGTSNERINLFLPETDSFGREVNAPSCLENTLTFSFNKKRTFFILKQINNIKFDTSFYYGTLLPAFEQYIDKWFALRLGLEGSYGLLNNSHQFGFGLVGGMTFRFLSSGIDVDLNQTFRIRPSRTIEGLLYPDFVSMIAISWKSAFIDRK